MQIAGPYVAWLDAPGGGGDRITVADRTSGAVVATFPGRCAYDPFDIDEQGTIAAVLDDRLVACSASPPRSRG